MRWLELTVVTGRESSEAVSGKLMELGAGGVLVEDILDWDTAKRAGLGDIFPEIAGDEGDTVTLRGYLPLSFLDGGFQELEEFLAQLPEFGLVPAVLTSREVNDADWENAWKNYWHPTPVGEKLLILPAWLESGNWPDRQVLRIDPGAAFGTGTHESTRLCLEFLEGNIRGGESMLDLGTGSGILALAARLLGADSVRGVDLDEAAVRSAKENAKRNQMNEIDFSQADLYADRTWDNLAPADIVTANLTSDVLIALCKRLHSVLRPGGRVIASGIVSGRREHVIQAYQDEGYTLTAERSAGEWVALLMESLP